MGLEEGLLDDRVVAGWLSVRACCVRSNGRRDAANQQQPEAAVLEPDGSRKHYTGDNHASISYRLLHKSMLLG